MKEWTYLDEKYAPDGVKIAMPQDDGRYLLTAFDRSLNDGSIVIIVGWYLKKYGFSVGKNFDIIAWMTVPEAAQVKNFVTSYHSEIASGNESGNGKS